MLDRPAYGVRAVAPRVPGDEIGWHRRKIFIAKYRRSSSSKANAFEHRSAHAALAFWLPAAVSYFRPMAREVMRSPTARNRL